MRQSSISIVNFRSLIFLSCCSLCLFSCLENVPWGLMGKSTYAMLYGICCHVDATLLLLECRICWGVSWPGVFRCRSSGLGITTLVSILLLENVFFEGISMHLILCSDSSSGAWSYSVPANLHVSIINLLSLWALPGSKQIPYLRWGTMQTQRWQPLLHTWLTFYLNNPAKTIC